MLFDAKIHIRLILTFTMERLTMNASKNTAFNQVPTTILFRISGMQLLPSLYEKKGEDHKANLRDPQPMPSDVALGQTARICLEEGFLKFLSDHGYVYRGGYYVMYFNKKTKRDDRPINFIIFSQEGEELDLPDEVKEVLEGQTYGNAEAYSNYREGAEGKTIRFDCINLMSPIDSPVNKPRNFLSMSDDNEYLVEPDKDFVPKPRKPRKVKPEVVI